MMKIAVLLTCFNRKDQTIICLNSLFECDLPEEISLKVFLVDDNSPDNTGKFIKNIYPEVNVIMGSGDLYWNGGMRMAWDKASHEYDFDFYLWLNDDTLLFKNSIQVLLRDYFFLKNTGINSIVVGSCISLHSKNFSYGGRVNNKPVIPSGIPQMCNMMNGNVVLIPKKIYKNVGNLLSKYTHSIGDIDYGLRAINKGYNLNISSEFVASCELNNILPWYSSKLNLKNRFKELLSIKNGNIKEYLRFIYFHKGFLGFCLSCSKTILRLFFPTFFSKTW